MIFVVEKRLLNKRLINFKYIFFCWVQSHKIDVVLCSIFYLLLLSIPPPNIWLGTFTCFSLQTKKWISLTNFTICLWIALQCLRLLLLFKIINFSSLKRSFSNIMMTLLAIWWLIWIEQRQRKIELIKRIDVEICSSLFLWYSHSHQILINLFNRFLHLSE